MGWIRRKNSVDRLGAGFHEDGVSLALLRPGADSGWNLVACTSIEGRDSKGLGGALGDWVNQHKARGATTVAAFEPQAYQLLHLEPPEVPDEEIRAALRWRIKDLIAYPAEQAIIDLYPPPASLANRVREFNVVVARESLVRDRIGLLESAGLRLEAIDIGELAQRNILAALPDPESGTALLNLDEDSGLITLVRSGEVFLARDLDLGLSALPAADQPAAEDPAYERFTLELQRSLDYYESALGQAPLTRILVHPGGPRTIGLTEYLGRNFFGVQVLELNLEDVVAVEPDQADQLLGIPAGMLAVGAALRPGAA